MGQGAFDFYEFNNMPEGPSIFILREELSQFKEKKVLSVSGNAKIDLQRMKGKKIIDIRSWGKHLLICFNGFFIRIHLLMFGSYRINDRKEVAPRLNTLRISLFSSEDLK